MDGLFGRTAGLMRSACSRAAERCPTRKWRAMLGIDALASIQGPSSSRQPPELQIMAVADPGNQHYVHEVTVHPALFSSQFPGDANTAALFSATAAFNSPGLPRTRRAAHHTVTMSSIDSCTVRSRRCAARRVPSDVRSRWFAASTWPNSPIDANRTASSPKMAGSPTVG
jgi:hypothetical protein